MTGGRRGCGHVVNTPVTKVPEREERDVAVNSIFEGIMAANVQI